jgi:glycerol-3-phosphate acyltransferase PlsY
MTKHTGIDITQMGSGNMGTANVFRIFGWRLGLTVLALDLTKGLLPVLVAQYLEIPLIYILLIGFFAMVGHCRSVFLKFKFRGKGAATGLGVLYGINFWIGLSASLAWIVMLFASRHSSAATLFAAITLVFLGIIFKVELLLFYFFIVIAILIFLTHSKNIKRLWRGEEPDIFAPQKIETGLTCEKVGVEFAKYSGKLNKPLGKCKNWVFLIHPLEIEDFLFVENNNNMKKLVEKFKKKPAGLMHSFLKGVGVRVVGDGYIKYDGKISFGMFVLVPYLPDKFQQAMEEYKNGKKDLLNEILGSIKEAIGLARSMGADYVGLGAFTSVVTLAGETLVKDGYGPVTAGNSLTAGGLCSGALDVAKKVKINPQKETVTIVGATGSVGRPTSQIMAESFRKIILCSQTPKKLEKLKMEILEKNPNTKITIETDVNKSIKESKLIVLAVSATKRDMNIDPDSFQSGSVCCDASRPLVIPDEFLEKRPDVFFMEGAIFQFPGSISCPQLLRMGADNNGFACLVETMIRALEDEKDSKGYGLLVDKDEARKMLHLVKKYRIKLTGHKFGKAQYVFKNNKKKYMRN